MRYLLRKPRKLVENTVVRNLIDDCIICDFFKCESYECCFRNGSFNSLFNFPVYFKHWIYYFMHTPSRNWSFPDPIPRRWHIHHINGDHLDDSPKNSVLLRNTVHSSLHNRGSRYDMNKELMKRRENRAVIRRANQQVEKGSGGITGRDDYHVFQL
jgi:hypothetical protein